MPVIPPQLRARRTPRLFLCAALATVTLACAAPARAVTLDAVAAPIVRVIIRSGDVSIRTWDRESVDVQGDPGLSVVRRNADQPAEQTPILIPQARAGPQPDAATLPSESFVVSSIPPGPRETIVVKGESAGTPVVVTVPADAVYVFAFARGGNLDVRDYRGGTLVGFTTRGRLALENVGGTVFAQTGRGTLAIDDSNIERLRARSLLGNQFFERCRVRQIEATSVGGSIVYDGGSFEPGLARFESTRGDVAIGAQGAAQLTGRVAGDGRVFTNFERAAQVETDREGTNAMVAGGGPIVTATSQSGNVYLYDGTLRTRTKLEGAWHAPTTSLLGTCRRCSAIPPPPEGAERIDARPTVPAVPQFPQPFVPTARPPPNSPAPRPKATLKRGANRPSRPWPSPPRAQP